MKIDIEFDEALREGMERLDLYREQHLELLGEALVMLAEKTMGFAKEFTVPVYTGYLRSTGWVDSVPDYGAGSIEVTLGFSAEYAAEQEIDGQQPGYRRDRPSAGRRYMRRAMLHTLADAEVQVARYMQRRTGGR